MGSSSRTDPRLPRFCLNRIAARVRVRSPPPPAETKPAPAADNLAEAKPSEEAAAAARGRRRIVIVVDASPESKTALLWALSHAVQSTDCIVLVNVIKPSSKRGDRSLKEKDPKSYELLHSMKSICKSKKPEVVVVVSLVEGTERGPAIVAEARKQGASLLVMGQKKRSVTWRLVMLWVGNKIAGSVADYCVQNAACMAVAVRRKSRRGGGYLITTKRHKDFWLLA
ncbi:universal stress protein PHOS32-like [Curcuma longa]|uniref:universal stress protein PHOS32-like n=1 Tax=Curcuma longa TaxID=136217 RepID=UPI003D9E2B0E